jgi:hypothetical protein
MRRRAIILVVLLAPLMVWARIGESLEQCIERYGQPTEQRAESGLAGFVKAGLRIIVHFHEGAADALWYQKQTKDDLGQPEELSETEIAVLLEANGNGTTWAKPGKYGLDTVWLADDGRLGAVYRYLSHELCISTIDYIDRQSADRAAAEKANLDGF